MMRRGKNALFVFLVKKVLENVKLNKAISSNKVIKLNC